MTKRRDFIRTSVIGTTGLAIGNMGSGCKSSDSTPPPSSDINSLRNWHSDPEWCKIKYGEWGGPGVSAGPGPMDTILCLDTSARDYEIGRTPRSSDRFLTKYKDRIMFGTDQGRAKSMYQIHWRLLETADEYIIGRVGWRYYGLELPAPVLEALYRGTAKKIFNI